MALRIRHFKKTFHFNFKARTSRGLMKDKVSWFFEVEDDARPGIAGWGECGPLPGLSPELTPDFEDRLTGILDEFNAATIPLSEEGRVHAVIPAEFSSVLFGVETAVRDLANGGKKLIFDNDFVAGRPIPINGLIWMGEMDFMMDQINQKIAQGFRCIKLKVGGLDFDKECDILGYIRKRYFRENILLRLDANGAFKPGEALERLHELAKYQIHSIEQPVKPGLVEMEELCRKSPIPVALDEEMIGINLRAERQRLLQKLRPAFIVLKPSLHGGIRGCEEWVALAESMQVGWWITSALESSIGLNAICQLTAKFKPILPQGLGTGAIYEDNFASPLTVKDGGIFYDPRKPWVTNLS